MVVSCRTEPPVWKELPSGTSSSKVEELGCITAALRCRTKKQTEDKHMMDGSKYFAMVGYVYTQDHAQAFANMRNRAM